MTATEIWVPTVMALGGRGVDDGSQDRTGMARWTSNARMIADIGESNLGYISGRTLDATYGLGNFWSLWKPEDLVASDLNPEKGTIHNWDFLTDPPPEWVDAFDTAVIDVPYKLCGRVEPKAHQSYGLSDGHTSTGKLANLEVGALNTGRCVKLGGHLLIKCQSQVMGGKVRWQARDLAVLMESTGQWVQEDEFIFQYRPRPQDSDHNGNQQHARRNYSVLLVMNRINKPTESE